MGETNRYEVRRGSDSQGEKRRVPKNQGDRRGKKGETSKENIAGSPGSFAVKEIGNYRRV